MNRPTAPPSPLAIFNEALDLDSPADRAAYLDRACGGDPDLRARVETLLAAHGRVGGFLESPAVPMADLDPRGPAEGVGTVIGPYKLMELLGEGGMGVVFVAEQTQPVRRKVALKVIKPGMDSRQVVARFEAERQALALMDHANIARVHDAGMTATGRPYFVMELVRGLPITEYCDRERLPIRERLELFVLVCRAVQHAHQRGVIHRDLKPSNILVTLHDGVPVPRVIDFGVAKATGQSLTDKTLYTGFHQLVGTPLYMSPEQVEMSGLDIDTRSDLYSLGVLLYELLTGTTPFDSEALKRAAFDEMRRIIREQEPPRPSTRLSALGETISTVSARRGSDPRRLGPSLRGELDWVVMKALEKDRCRRYETANDFAADLMRYLTDEPVLACPPSAWYRFGKFARRNKVSLTLTGVVLSFLVVLGIGIGWVVRDRDARAAATARERQDREAEIARDRAAREAAVEQEATQALKEAGRWQEQGNWPEALAAAERAQGSLAGGGRDGLRERVRQLRRDLEMAHALDEIPLLACENMVTRSLNFAAVDRAYARAFADYGIDVAVLPPEQAAALLGARPGMAAALAAALDYWAYARARRGDQAGGQALTALAQAVDPDPWRRCVREAAKQGDRKALGALAASPELLRQPPTSLLMLVRMLSAADLAGPASDVLVQSLLRYPGDFWLNYFMAHTLDAQGPRFRSDAIAFHRAALAVRPRSARAHNCLGNVLLRQGRLEEAIAHFKRVVELMPKFADPHWGLGLCLQKQGKLDEAVAEYRKAIALNPNDLESHGNLGNVLSTQGKLDEAIAELRKAIALAPDSAQAHTNLGCALSDQGKLDEALAECRKAVELDPKFAPAHHNLGCVLRSQKKLDEAVVEYRKAIALDPNYAQAHAILGLTLKDQGELDEAVAECRKAIALDPKSAPFREYLCATLQVLGWARYRAGAWRESIEALEESCKLQAGGTGDAGQWIVLALAHARLAEQAGLSEKEREQHRTEAHRRYDEASQQIDQRWRVRPDHASGQAIWDFRAEARALLEARERKQ